MESQDRPRVTEGCLVQTGLGCSFVVQVMRCCVHGNSVVDAVAVVVEAAALK